MNKKILLIFFFISLLPALRAQQKINYRQVPAVDSAEGLASFYADKFEGRKTANGEVFTQGKMTCAHNTLPFGTKIKVTNLNNDKFVIVRVNDRLHHRNPRLVDLTTTAAKQLKFKGKGVVRVRIEVVKPQEKEISPSK
ncbi:MAG: septal ring lytic transglycosylase RlpA family protein [Chitinophagia bacterium]